MQGLEAVTGPVTVRERVEVLDVLRGWCPGGKLREVFEAAGRVQ